MKWRRAALAGVLCLCFSGRPLPDAYAEPERNQRPDFLTFDELKTLSANPFPEGPLRKKLEKFWVTPLISNEASMAGAKPIVPRDPLLGPSLRIAT